MYTATNDTPLVYPVRISILTLEALPYLNLGFLSTKLVYSPSATLNISLSKSVPRPSDSGLLGIGLFCIFIELSLGNSLFSPVCILLK